MDAHTKNSKRLLKISMSIPVDINMNNISDWDYVCILSGAMSGCAYWCVNLKYDKGEYENARKTVQTTNVLGTIAFEDVLLQMLKEDKAIVFCDEDGNHSLTLEKLNKGIEMHNKSGDADEDMDCWDDCDYDCVIQYALFEEIVYG